MNINPLTTTSSQKKSTSVSAELLQWNRTAKHQMSQSLEAVVRMVNDLEKWFLSLCEGSKKEIKGDVLHVSFHSLP